MSSTVGTDGTYQNENTAYFTGGSLHLVLDQTTPLLAAEAKQVGAQADKVMGRLVCTAFGVGSLITDYIEKHQVRQGSSSTTGASSQDVGKLSLCAQLTVSVGFAVPEFILSEAVDQALQDFRKLVRVEMDPSYKAFLAEEEARKAAALFGGLLPAEAIAFLSSMLGEDIPLGEDGMSGMIVGKPFGPFGRGKGGFAG